MPVLAGVSKRVSRKAGRTAGKEPDEKADERAGRAPSQGSPERRSVPAGVVAVVLGAALLVALTAAVSWGSTDIPPGQVWSVVGRRLAGEAPRPGTNDLIVWQLRVPRALLAAIVGAGLGLVGTAVQALVRNPLADPYLLGISNGASLGAVAAIVLGAGAGGVLGLGLSGAAFAGALATFGLVWAIARRGGGFSPLRLVLAGVGIGQFLSGFTSYLVLQAGDEQQTQSVLFWLMGSLSGASWDLLAVPAIAVPAGLLLLQARARALNAVMMGDETAAGLGVDVTRLRRELFVLTSVLTGILVAVSGAIAFVGLMVPHACRLIVGGDHRRLLPVSALFGALLLVVVDIICRTAMDNQELPVGVVTSLIGAPALLYLLDRRLGSGS
ncbi:iron ABC transporter permease [Streptomyces lunaelactis]|uniref:FecCD family ABC transporter permease n=1 Tax=Streptomyces lunaelactis TaxID=1535768 RepID=UPI001584BDCC|nr:iron ABC transporter permease [Streptomyces lunaelactis]NUK38390.1 iron ABC transporter permease [Streptomyces lunaelactis]NUK45701.1 iron ABC transporter permease [Streptomyces lunaelactis]NUK96100.1 iron ABC transporter permease [Streptomyces lunaelactis]NUL33942.1 iron ABC transporter permease [Streptomyces lunaelactis]